MVSVFRFGLVLFADIARLEHRFAQISFRFQSTAQLILEMTFRWTPHPKQPVDSRAPARAYDSAIDVTFDQTGKAEYFTSKLTWGWEDCCWISIGIALKDQPIRIRIDAQHVVNFVSDYELTNRIWLLVSNRVVPPPVNPPTHRRGTAQFEWTKEHMDKLFGTKAIHFAVRPEDELWCPRGLLFFNTWGGSKHIAYTEKQPVFKVIDGKLMPIHMRESNGIEVWRYTDLPPAFEGKVAYEIPETRGTQGYPYDIKVKAEEEGGVVVTRKGHGFTSELVIVDKGWVLPEITSKLAEPVSATGSGPVVLPVMTNDANSALMLHNSAQTASRKRFKIDREIEKLREDSARVEKNVDSAYEGFVKLVWET